MAVLPVKKVSITVHRSVEEEVFGKVQAFGRCEVVPLVSQGDVSHAAARLAEVDDTLADVRFALRFLEPHFSGGGGGLALLFGDKPQVTLPGLAQMSHNLSLPRIVQDLREKERRLNEIRTEKSLGVSVQNVLQHLEGFPYPLVLLTEGTARVQGIFGTVACGNMDEAKRLLSSALQPMGEIFPFIPKDPKEKEGHIALIFPREQYRSVEELLAGVGFSRTELPGVLGDTVEEEQRRFSARAVELAAQEEALISATRDLAARWVPDLRHTLDYLSVVRDRRSTLLQGMRTEQVLMISLWCPAPEVTRLQKVLDPFSQEIDVALADPEEGETPPTVFQNSLWAGPFEPLTKLFGVPEYGAIDPTALMAPFFVLFFGMCFGDGGYGIITGGIAFYLFKKYRMTGDARGYVLMIMAGSVSTILYGALTGSWFGDMIDAFPFLHVFQPLKNSVTIMDPVKDPMTVLKVSLALGVVQIFFGLFVALYDNVRKGSYMAAFSDQGGWLVFLTGLILLGGGASGALPAEGMAIYQGVAALGALILFLTQGREKEGIFRKALSGALSIYSVSSYLGDVLSYSRLLALGMASAAVGMIVNMLAVLISDVPYVGWLLGAVLFVGGHLFSIAVNVLGAFIHSLRLQYVEFFSKFYGAGGRIFSPLRYDTKFVAIVDKEPEGAQIIS